MLFARDDKVVRWQSGDAQHPLWRVTCARSSRCGRRQSMEDSTSVQHNSMALVAAVFDGHYGPRCARYAAKHLPRCVLAEICRDNESPPVGFLRSLLEHTTLASNRCSDGSAATCSTLATSSNTESSVATASLSESLTERLTRCCREVDARWLSKAKSKSPPATDGTEERIMNSLNLAMLRLKTGDGPNTTRRGETETPGGGGLGAGGGSVEGGSVGSGGMPRSSLACLWKRCR